MLSSPHVTHSPAQTTAVIRLTIPRAGIRTVMGPGIAELMQTLAAQGIAPAGPWFTHHLRMTPDVFDFEIGIPTDRPVSPAGRVQPGMLPEATVARAVHEGSYEALGASWGEFSTWIAAEGHTPAADLWERYVVGPESGDDDARYRTELNQPLVARGDA